MIFSTLQKASDYEVEEYFITNLDLTPYQKQKMKDRELIRFSGFRYYKYKKQQTSALWRLTLVVYPLYWVILFLFLPFNFIFTGRWGYSVKFQDGFHRRWISKLGL